MSKNKVYLSLADKQKIVGKAYTQLNQIKATAHQYNTCSQHKSAAGKPQFLPLASRITGQWLALPKRTRHFTKEKHCHYSTTMDSPV